MAKVVKSKLLTVLDRHPGFLRCRPEIISNEDRSGEWNAALSAKRRIIVTV
jgi:hypothetical protein